MQNFGDAVQEYLNLGLNTRGIRKMCVS